MKHIKTIHDGVKFLCAQCDYKATQKDNLLTHIKTKHELKVSSFLVLNVITRQQSRDI